MSLKWRGGEILKRVEAASRRGVDATMAAAVIQAKSSHPGWKNRTGTAEGSIRIVEPAGREGDAIVGRWGSADVNYMIWLELKHGSALRNAADREYPRLASRIKGAL